MFQRVWFHCLGFAFILSTQSGCTALSADVTGSAKTGIISAEQKQWERANRGVHRFNTGLDRTVVKPLAKGYQAVTPVVVDRGVTNFFGNLSDVKTTVNSLLQLKGRSAASSAGRVVVNSTVGIGGIFDVASKLKLKKYHEDFGQTMARWGVKSGPYVMLPLLGPSTVRDTVGLVADGFIDPSSYIKYPVALTAVKIVDKRADLLNADEALKDLSADQYSALRNVWLQRRAYQLRDGKEDAASKIQKNDMIDLLEELEDE